MHIKVIITDDHLMLVNGLVHSLSDYHHINVIGTYNTGAALMQGLNTQQSDILLLDLQLPDCMGNELALKIRTLYPDIRIIVFTGIESSFHIKDILQQGCMGYLYKTSTTSELLIKAIETVYAGEIFVDPGVKDHLINNIIKKSKVTTTIQLSKREKEILHLIATSHTSPEIAQKLFISHRTVENHRFSLMQKLSVKNAAGLILKAMQMGLLD